MTDQNCIKSCDHRYIKLFRCYHQLHAQLSSLTIDLEVDINSVALDGSVKSMFRKTVRRHAAEISEIDSHVKDAIKSKLT